MKKLVSILLALVMVVSLLPTAVFAVKKESNDTELRNALALTEVDVNAEGNGATLDYTVDEDGVMTITLKADIAVAFGDSVLVGGKGEPAGEATEKLAISAYVLDMNGYTISGVNEDKAEPEEGGFLAAPLFAVNGAKLTVMSSKDAATITAMGQAFDVQGEDAALVIGQRDLEDFLSNDSENNQNVIVNAFNSSPVMEPEEGDEERGYDGAAIVAGPGATVDIYSTVNAERGIALQIQGSDALQAIATVHKDAVLKGGTGIAISGAKDESRLTIYNAYIQGTKCGVAILGGNTYICDGTIIGGEVGLYVDANKQTTDLIILGGHFDCANRDADAEEGKEAMGGGVYLAGYGDADAEEGQTPEYLSKFAYRGYYGNTDSGIMDIIVDTMNFMYEPADTDTAADAEVGNWNVWPRGAKPMTGEGYDVNYEDDTIYARAGYEISAELGGPYTNAIALPNKWADETSRTFYVRAIGTSITAPSLTNTFVVYPGTRCSCEEALLGMDNGIRYLYLNGQKASDNAYQFVKVVNNKETFWTIQECQRDKTGKFVPVEGRYLSTQNGTKIEYTSTPTYWTYDGVGLCVAIKDNPIISARKLITRLFDSIFSFVTTGGLSAIKVGTYYLATNVSGTGTVIGLQGVEGVPVLAQQYHTVHYAQHDWTYTAVDDTHHATICANCGEVYEDMLHHDGYDVCHWDKTTHLCHHDCGNMDSAYLPVITVDDTYTRTSLITWRHVYNVTIDPNKLACEELAYSIDGGIFYWDVEDGMTPAFTASTNPTSFRVRVTNDAGIYYFVYDHGVVSLLSFDPAN